VCEQKEKVFQKTGAWSRTMGLVFGSEGVAEIEDVAIGPQATDDFGAGRGVPGEVWEPTGTLPSSPTRTRVCWLQT
jgi:hypothetical protein